MKLEKTQSKDKKPPYVKERELLHEQLELLAEKSKGCKPKMLAVLSKRMTAIYLALKQ